MTTQTKSTFIHDDQRRPVVKRTGLLPRILRPFRCRVCLAWFDSVERYSQHTRRHRTKFGWKHTLCKHSVVKCNRKQFACRLCQKRLIYGHSVGRVTREKEDLYQCAYCQKRFTQGHILQDHIRIHIKNEPYQCGRCQKSFAVISLLQMHIGTHTKEKPVQSGNDQCSKTHTEEKPQRFDQDSAPQTNEGRENCQKCTTNEKHVCGLQTTEKVYCRNDSSTEKQSGVTNAVENLRHSQNKNIQNTFMLESKVKRGGQVHKERKRWNQCVYCAKYFISPSHLKVHVKIHTGERNFKCENCDKAFLRKTDLEIHYKSKTHISGKPYARQVRKGIKRPHKCAYCEKSFPSPSHLKAHVAMHTDERNYKCEVCDMWFRRRSSLELHYKSKIHLKKKMLRLKINSSGHSKTRTEGKLYGAKERHCQKSPTDEKPSCGLEAIGTVTSQDTSTEEEQSGIVNTLEIESQNEKTTLEDNMEQCKEVHKGNKRRNKCDYCTKYFQSPSHLKAHIAIHSDERNYKCDICDKSFQNRTNLNTHYKTMLHNNNMKQLHSKNNLNRHPETETEEKLDVNYLDSHTTERSMNCEKTDKKPISEPRAKDERVISQNSHSTEKHGIIETNATETSQNESGQINTAPDDPDDEMERSKQAHDERNRSYKCEYCGKLCSKRGPFECHRRACAREKPFKCQYCQQCFAEKSALKRHILKIHGLHALLHPNKCKRCGEKFAHPSDLMEHVRTHKKYQCRFCQEHFHQSSQCKVHEMQVHAGKFVHKCNFCGKAFPALRLLTVHTRKIHTKPIQCEHCGKRFANSSYLKQHMVTHSNEKPFKCDSCSNAYKYKKDLLKHVWNCHTNAELDLEESGTGHLKNRTEANIYGANKERHCQKSPTDEKLTCGLEAKDEGVISQNSHSTEKHCIIEANATKTPQNESGQIKTAPDDEMERSKQAHDERKRSYKCEYCAKCFPSPGYLGKHTATHKSEEDYRFKCDICGKLCSKRGPFECHRRACAREKPFKCQYCQLCFAEKSALKRHIIKMHGLHPNKCKHCGEKFEHPNDLMEHVRTHKKYQCGFCGERFHQSSQCKEHEMQVHAGKFVHKCNFCGKAFPALRLLNVHTRKIHTKPIQCELCEKRFANSSYLKQHMVTHSNEKPFKCDSCSNAYKYKKDLLKHVWNRHTNAELDFEESQNEKTLLEDDMERSKEVPKGIKYKCDYCTKYFQSPSHLKAHIVIHCDERPFQCETCGICFKNPHTLKAHYRTHTGEKPHTCSYCQRSFAQKHTLTEHIRTHTKEKPYQCEECGKCFTQGRDLKRHQRVHRGLPTKNKEWWGKKKRIKSTPPEPLNPFQSNAVSHMA